MRVWSLRRLPGLNWAKAMRDMRSAPNTAWGLRLDTEASCSPDSSSISDDTTLVVPISTAIPNFRSAVSPASTARMRRPQVVTVTSPACSRSALGQGADDFGGDVLLAPPDGAEQLLEVGGLVVLLLGQLHVDQVLPDARVDGHALQRRRRRLRAEDLEAPLVERGRHLHRDRLEHAALTGEAIALAHEGVAELELVHHGGRRHGAGGELHPAGRAAAAAAAGGGDVHPRRMRGAEDGGARLDLEGSRVGQHGESHGGHAVRG